VLNAWVRIRLILLTNSTVCRNWGIHMGGSFGNHSKVSSPSVDFAQSSTGCVSLQCYDAPWSITNAASITDQCCFMHTVATIFAKKSKKSPTQYFQVSTSFFDLL